MKKKLAALLIATALSISALAGCGSSKADESSQKETSSAGSVESAATESSEAASTSQENKEPDKLKIWVSEKLRVMDWETNSMTLWLEEQGNLDLEFEVIPSADYKTKVSMALTVGDVEELPDVIIGSFTNNNVWEYAQAETILPLTDYYNDPKLAVNIMEAFERTGVKYTDLITSPDGNIYGVASFNQSYGNEYPHKMWIYKPWLDALGEDVPTTTEEYYELLKKVSQTDLNGNGKADEIGLAGNAKSFHGYFYYLMNAFVYAGDPTQLKVIEDGVVSTAYTTEEWKAGLKYIRQMFEEGLILSESLTMDDEQFKTLLNGEEPTVFSYCYLAVNDAGTRKEDYIGIDSLTGPEGVNYATYRPTTPSVSFLVTANCENPEAAFRLGDLLSSEQIGISQRWGEEGVNWDYAENLKDASEYVAGVDGFDLSIVAYDDSAFWGGSEAQNASWMQTGPYVRQYAIANGLASKPENIDKYKAEANRTSTMYQTSGHNPKEVATVLNYTSEESDEIVDIENSLLTYVNEFKAGVLSGNIDIDKEWDAYLKEIDKIDLDAWLEVVQNVYDRMYK